MRRAVLLFTLPLLACGDSPTEPRIIDIAGNWSYTETINSSSAGISCNNSGTININQSGSNFTGTYDQDGLCTDSFGNQADNSGSGQVGGGQLTDNNVSFSAEGFNYTGTITGNPANRISGSVSGTVAIGGQNYTFTGTWTATR